MGEMSSDTGTKEWVNAGLRKEVGKKRNGRK